MKRCVAVIAVAVALGAAPVAHADENAFYAEVAQKVDLDLTNTQAMYLAMIACNAIRDGLGAGLTPSQAQSKADAAVGWAQNDMRIDLSAADTANLVQAAQDHVC